MIGSSPRDVTTHGLCDGEILLGKFKIGKNHIVELIDGAQRQLRNRAGDGLCGQELATPVLNDVEQGMGAEKVSLGDEGIAIFVGESLYFFSVGHGSITLRETAVESAVSLLEHIGVGTEVGRIDERLAPVAVGAATDILPDVGTTF